ncbi:hypothetical protein [Jiangella alba]|uniref:Fibronectin type-III domain-containing protein n=1 Tax=Jiangella alba TaxID=561176 RepID=A0A1H5JH40_9ACTN|nr:hypothetical protein [Jiangella alba]SEE51557.1 hypothetical protein SAMN04488561_1573 [Jiangella alba]
MNTVTQTSAAAQADVDIVIDNPQATLTGTWQTSTFQKNFYGADYAFTNRSAVSPSPRVARWTPDLPGPGSYTVAVWLPDGNNDRSDAVTYRVRHDGGEWAFVLDQTIGGGYWRQLGRGPLTFSGDGTEYLELRVADVEPRPGNAPTYVQVDAVRFATPPPPLTSAPAGVGAAVARNYAEITWQPLDGAAGYVVSRALGAGEPEEVAEVQGTGYLDLSLDPRQSYHFTVAGVNGAGLGPASAAVPARYTAGVPLEAVQGLVVAKDGANAVLQWQPSFDATSYRVERAPVSGRPGTVIATVDGTTFVDTPPGPEAHYIVRSVNQRGACLLSSWQVTWMR